MNTGFLIVLLALPALSSPGERTMFSSWRDFFSSRARTLDMAQGADDVFAFAADSDLQVVEGDPSLVLVRANLYSWENGVLFNRLRGASGNGPFYLVRRSGKGLRYLGEMEGSACRSAPTDSKNASVRRFECFWNLGGGTYRLDKYEANELSLRNVETTTVNELKW